MLETLIKDIRNLLPPNYNFHIDVSSIGIDIIFGEECFEPEAFIVTYGWEKVVYLHTDKLDYELGLCTEELRVINYVANYLEQHKEYINKVMGEFK